jgi:tetratricopeptide (TPR) repeat protein
MNQNIQPLPKPPLRFFWLWVALIILCLASLAPGMKLLQSLRAQWDLNKAEKAFQAGALPEAEEFAYAALRKKPQNIEACRILGKIADLREYSESLRFWHRVVHSPEVRFEDRVALVEAAIRQQELSLAEQQLGVILGSGQPTAHIYNLAGLLSLRQRRPAVARQWFQMAVELDSNFFRSELNLARLDLYFPKDQKARKDGIQRLKKLSQRNDIGGLESLRTLVEYGQQNPKNYPYEADTGSRLGTHPLASQKDSCLVIDWQLACRERDLDSVVREFDKNTDKLDVREKIELATWFNSKKLHRKTLEAFPLDPEAPRELILLQLDAMAALDKWNELSDFLAGNIRLEPVLVSLFRARVAKELGDQRLFELGWRKSLRESGRNPVALRYLARYAGELGEKKRSAEALEELSRVPGFEGQSLLELIPIYEHLRDTRSLLNTLHRLVELRPDDLVINSDVAYLGLLLNDSSVYPFERAKKVYTEGPRIPAFASTYALSQLRLGFPAIALSAFDQFTLGELTAPGWQAVYAATLLANGRRADAVKIVESIDLGNLKPEEKLLISKLLVEAGRPPSGS